MRTDEARQTALRILRTRVTVMDQRQATDGITAVLSRDLLNDPDPAAALTLIVHALADVTVRTAEQAGVRNHTAGLLGVAPPRSPGLRPGL